MTRQVNAGDDYREVLDPRRRRKALLYRAALAIAVMIVLVIGLSLYDEDVAESPLMQGSVARPEVLRSPVSEQAPVEEGLTVIPRIDAYESEAPALTAENDVDEAGGDDAGLNEAAVDVAHAVSSSDLTAEDPSVPAEDGGAELPAPVSEVPSPPAVAAVSSKPSQPVSTARAVPSVPRGFQVLASDFVDPPLADTLLDGLSGAGYQAQSQSRVTVGPFARRAEAERATARLRSEHALRGIIVDAPSGTGFAVQLGVFAEARNAVALVRRLQASGHSAALHRRVLLGPFTDRQAAETIVAELRVRDRKSVV